MKVVKFGGSSVASATNISRVIDIVESAASAERVILVSSAISGCTDGLLAIGRKAAAGEDFSKELQALKSRHEAIINRLFTGSEKEEALADNASLFEEVAQAPEVIEAYGELLSTRIIARKIACEGYSTKWLDSRKLVKRDDMESTYANIREAAACDAHILVAPGFIASDNEGRTCTLGRGGSDYSAAIFAAAVNADSLEIWTDVPGIMTANPKVVPAAHTVSSISYEAALNLARNGAKVLYAPTVKPAMEAGIAFKILNTFDPANPGTTVSDIQMPKVAQWRGVTHLENGDVATICLVGEGPISEESTMNRICAKLRESGIRNGNCRAENGCFFVEVSTAEAKDATAAIHREFFETRDLSEIMVFIAGYGAVGQSLVRTIYSSAGSVGARTGRSLRIAGLSDSRHFLLDRKGVDCDNLENGSDASGWAYIDEVCKIAPRGAVFVDCTNSEEIGSQYEKLFKKGIGIVSSNRRALSGPYSQYAALKATAREYGAHFRYDTTVGTALPILESISNAANSCDRLVRIDAVISCTINNILTQYDGPRGETFATLLRRAQFQGLTEKDPRQDLGGRDVVRKLLILGREAGIPLEASDVKVEPMLASSFFNCPIEEFYRKLEDAEDDFVERENELDRMAIRQRYVASIERDPDSPLGYKAYIRMKLVGKESPFYWISGTENVSILQSEFITTPLVLKGAGEGARLAAMNIINNILKQ